MLGYLKYLIYIDILLLIGIMLFRSALKPAFRDLIGRKEIILVLFTPAVALLSGNIYIFDGYLAVAIGLTSRTRREVAAIYLMMLPLVPELVIETRVGGVYIFAITTIFSMNFGALVGFLLTSKRLSFARPILDISAIIIILMFSYIAIDLKLLNFTIAIRTLLVNMIILGVPYLIISRSISNKDDLDRIIIRFVFSGILCALVIIFQSTRHWVLYEGMSEALHVPLPAGTAALALRGGLLRSGGTMIDYSVGGLFVACVLAVFPAMVSRFRQGWLIALGGLLLTGLFLTQSRGAWVALAAGWLACLLYRGYIARAFALASGLALVQLLFIPLLTFGSSKLGETFGASGHSAETAEYRSTLFKRGLQEIAAHPWTGQDSSQLHASMSDMMQGQHIIDFVNTHLFMALAMGLPGLVLWTAIWVTPIAMTWTNRPQTRSRNVIDPAEMPMAIIVTGMVAMAFTSSVDRNLLWPMLALGMVGPCLNMRKLANRMDTAADHLQGAAVQRVRMPPASGSSRAVGSITRITAGRKSARMEKT